MSNNTPIVVNLGDSKKKHGKSKKKKHSHKAQPIYIVTNGSDKGSRKKRPPNAWNLFVREQFPIVSKEIKEKNGGKKVDMTDVQAVIRNKYAEYKKTVPKKEKKKIKEEEPKKKKHVKAPTSDSSESDKSE